MKVIKSTKITKETRIYEIHPEIPVKLKATFEKGKLLQKITELKSSEVDYQSQEPKPVRTKEKLRKIRDKYKDESMTLYADLTELINSLDQSQEPKQTEVSEDLQYQNLTCLVNGFELNTYQKALAKQEYKKLLAMKEREVVDNDMEFLLAWWMGKGDEYRNKTLFSDAIKDYDQSKITHYPFYF
jgi:hypothetical protein